MKGENLLLLRRLQRMTHRLERVDQVCCGALFLLPCIEVIY
jgi:hypothetical protein